MNLTFVDEISTLAATEIHDATREALKLNTTEIRLRKDADNKRLDRLAQLRKIAEFLPTVGSTLIINVKNHGQVQITRIGTGQDQISITEARIVTMPKKKRTVANEVTQTPG